MNILIAPDKFKGSLTAAQATGAIRRGLEKAWPGARCREFPIADGGEGTAEVICAALGGEWLSAPAHDPLGEPVQAGYGWLSGGVAVIAMSSASGLWRMPVEKRAILRASTFGTGELMAHAIRRGARKLLLGLGGSATNDGGVGMAAALGWQFLDENGGTLEPIPAALPALYAIRRPAHVLPEIVAICDVSNPLLGPCGATWTYGPQKGGDAQTLPVLERALAHLADVVARELGVDFRAVPGTGAAGGLGYGLLSFCGARLASGFETVAEVMGLETAIAASDLVVTGEGRLDRQTLHGKGPAGVASLAHKHGKQVIAFAGEILDPAALGEIFDGTFAIREEGMALETVMREAGVLLERKAASVCQRADVRTSCPPCGAS